MTPFMKWLRGSFDKLFGRYYEGPDPPERLHRMVLAFAEQHPHATRDDWVSFTSDFGAEMYKSGYVRGVEYVERDLDTWRTDLPPEMLMDMIDPDWRWSPPVDLRPDHIVPAAIDETELTEDQVAEVNSIARMLRGARPG